ncbi:MAG: hypothetical protein ACOCUL_03305 [Bacteroidota bacterium]
MLTNFETLLWISYVVVLVMVGMVILLAAQFKLKKMEKEKKSAVQFLESRYENGKITRKEYDEIKNSLV